MNILLHCCFIHRKSRQTIHLPCKGKHFYIGIKKKRCNSPNSYTTQCWFDMTNERKKKFVFIVFYIVAIVEKTQLPMLIARMLDVNCFYHMRKTWPAANSRAKQQHTNEEKTVKKNCNVQWNRTTDHRSPIYSAIMQTNKQKKTYKSLKLSMKMEIARWWQCNTWATNNFPLYYTINLTDAAHENCTLKYDNSSHLQI